jgi:hypothetical protein
VGTDVQNRACGLRCRLLPGILVVESAEKKTGDYLQFPLWGYADCAASYGTGMALRRNPRPKTAVRAPSIVMTNPFRQERAEMPFAQRDHEIQTLASYGPDQSFTKCIPLR